MSQFRPPIIRSTAAPNDRERYLDEGLLLSPLHQRGVLAAYSLAMLGAALAILLVPGLAPAPAAILFIVLAVAHPLAAKRANTVQLIVGQHIVEGLIMGVVVLAAPQFWQVACVWMGTSLTWSAFAMPRRPFVPVFAGTAAAMSLVAWTSGVPAWPAGVVAAVVVAVMSSELGNTIRRSMSESQQAVVDSISASGGFIVRADLEAGTVTSIEGDIEGVLGWTPEAWCATSPRDRIHPDDVAGFWIDPDAVRPGTVIDRIARFRHADGSWVWLRDVTRVDIDDDGNHRAHGVVTDISELMDANVQIARQARHDSLTGLPNRLALVERTDSLLDDGAPFALLMLDLDRFKEVNDTLGHEAGDQMLTVVAERIQRIISTDDLLARLGGDEFAIVLHGATSESDIRGLLRELSDVWSQPLTVRGVRTAISGSIGVAFSDSRRTDRATLMRHADIAMYEAKRNGGGAKIFDDSLELTSTMQLSLSASLPTAIADGDIKLYFQPKFDMVTGHMVGAEGLARWEHPELGVLAPNVFLDLTLMSEYAVAFALRTIDDAIDAIERLIAGGSPVPVAANVAIGALRDIDFGDEVLRRLADRNIDPSLLVVELTESDVLGNSAGLVTSFEQLTAAGVTMSIDDFGTGHSSLERLRVLDVGELKIDRSFVDGMSDSPLDRKIVETIVDLAHRMGCNVVAEGVETEQQVTDLVELGCTTAQGYLYARPMPLDDLLATVGRRVAASAAVR